MAAAVYQPQPEFSAAYNTFNPPPPAPEQPLAGPRTFNFEASAVSRTSVFIDEATQQIAYTSKVSSWRPGKPDITLHAGTDKTAPIAGVCWTHRRQDELGLGDPNMPHAVVWEKMHMEGRLHVRFTFEATVGGERRPFEWKQTKDKADKIIGGNRLNSSSFALEDVQLGQRIALYAVKGGYTKTKKILKFVVPVPQELEIWTVLSCATCQLRADRRRAAAASSAAAAGSV